MKLLLVSLILLVNNIASAQSDFNNQVSKIADTLAKKIIQTQKQRAAVTEFVHLDESISMLGQFLSDELSSGLSNLTENLTKFQVIERSNIELIRKEKKILQSFDGSKMARELGRINAADILIWAIVSDFEGFYRVNIKLLDTHSGNALSSYIAQFIKTPTLESYAAKTIRKSDIQLTGTQPQAAAPVVNTVQPTTGTIEIANNINRTLTILLGTEQVEPANFSIKYEQLTVSPKSVDSFPAIKPGIYYVCAVQSRNNFEGCIYIKKVKVEAGQTAKVNINSISSGW